MSTEKTTLNDSNLKSSEWEHAVKRFKFFPIIILIVIILTFVLSLISISMVASSGEKEESQDNGVIHASDGYMTGDLYVIGDVEIGTGSSHLQVLGEANVTETIYAQDLNVAETIYAQDLNVAETIYAQDLNVAETIFSQNLTVSKISTDNTTNGLDLEADVHVRGDTNLHKKVKISTDAYGYDHDTAKLIVGGDVLAHGTIFTFDGLSIGSDSFQGYGLYAGVEVAKISGRMEVDDELLIGGPYAPEDYAGYGFMVGQEKNGKVTGNFEVDKDLTVQSSIFTFDGLTIGSDTSMGYGLYAGVEVAKISGRMEVDDELLIGGPYAPEDYAGYGFMVGQERNGKVTGNFEVDKDLTVSGKISGIMHAYDSDWISITAGSLVLEHGLTTPFFTRFSLSWRDEVLHSGNIFPISNLTPSPGDTSGVSIYFNDTNINLNVVGSSLASIFDGTVWFSADTGVNAEVRLMAWLN